MKRRLDVLLVARGLAETREKAQRLIMAGAVFVNDRRATQASALAADDTRIEVRGGLPYVSRGGFKLAAALDAFQIDVHEQVCADVGASTGGFTDVLLQRGASKIYAIDVGYGQLDWKLRNDPRVVVMERTNIREIGSLPEPIAFACVDVSFISLKLVLPVVKRLIDRRPPTADGDKSAVGRQPSVVALIKPQFEAGKGQVAKGGVVRDPKIHRAVLEETLEYCANNNWAIRGLMASPIKGPAGNVEFLMQITSSPSADTTLPSSLIDDALAAAAKL